MTAIPWPKTHEEKLSDVYYAISGILQTQPWKGECERIREIVKKTKFDVNWKPPTDVPLIWKAAETDHSALETLLELGADPNVRRVGCNKLLLGACIEQGLPKHVDALLSYGANVHRVTSQPGVIETAIEILLHHCAYVHRGIKVPCSGENLENPSLPHTRQL